jgi:hypothetical protein
MIVGNARVSTDGQTLDAQHSALRQAGGAKTDRQQLAKAITALAQGDTLIVTKLDRLARSTRDLLNTLAEIAKAGANFQITWRSLVRYDFGAWPIDADCVGRVGGIRASLNPGADKRRPTARPSSWSALWAQALPYSTSTTRSIGEESSG